MAAHFLWQSIILSCPVHKRTGQVEDRVQQSFEHILSRAAMFVRWIPETRYQSALGLTEALILMWFDVFMGLMRAQWPLMPF